MQPIEHHWDLEPPGNMKGLVGVKESVIVFHDEPSPHGGRQR
jgi:hypothetical protein